MESVSFITGKKTNPKIIRIIKKLLRKTRINPVFHDWDMCDGSVHVLDESQISGLSPKSIEKISFILLYTEDEFSDKIDHYFRCNYIPKIVLISIKKYNLSRLYQKIGDTIDDSNLQSETLDKIQNLCNDGMDEINKIDKMDGSDLVSELLEILQNKESSDSVTLYK